MAEDFTVRVHFIDETERIVPIKPGSLQAVGEEGARRAIALVDEYEVRIYNRVEWGYLWEEQMSMDEWLAAQVEEKE
jgi:hypothetical protein